MEQYLIFDIETSPDDFDSLDESQQEYLLRRCETDEDTEKAKMEMALSPLTSKVVCIGLQLMQSVGPDEWETVNKAAYAVDESMEDNAIKTEKLGTGDPCYLTTERKMLEDFWTILRKYNNSVLVSFNGRNFDAPYLMLRSALHRIKPSRNLMAGTKFNYPMHIDLIDQLSFFSTSYYGATRRYNFDFYARAFGIKSPKSEGIDGSMVGEFYRAGKITEIAEYCLRDVTATWELFLIWHKYLKY